MWWLKLVLVLLWIFSANIFFYRDVDHLDLHELTHSFPTRRSSALSSRARKSGREETGRSGGTRTHGPRFWRPMLYQLSYTPKAKGGVYRLSRASTQARSEEHKSELQSLMRNSYADFCLKKNKAIIQTYTTDLEFSNTRLTPS